MRQLTLRLLAIGTLLLFLAGVLWPYPSFFRTTLVFAVIAYASAAFCGFKFWQKSSDPYNLNSLNELMREGTYDDLDVPLVDPDGDKYCLSCHCVYGSQFGVCPNCAKK